MRVNGSPHFFRRTGLEGDGNLASVVVHLAAGLVRFDLGLTMAAGQLIGWRLGSRVVVRGGAKAVRPVLLTVALALTAKLLWDNFR